MTYEIKRLQREIAQGETYLQKSPWPEWFYSGLIMGIVGGVLLFAMNTSESPELRTIPEWIKWFVIYFILGSMLTPINRFMYKLSIKKNKKKLLELIKNEDKREA